MNRKTAQAGALLLTVTIVLFLLFLIIDFPIGSYFVCIFLAIGFTMTVSGLYLKVDRERKLPALIGLIFAGVYNTLIFIVYFTQLTSVRLDGISGLSARILDYSQGGLMFNLDLFGYGIMALSTFFIGLALKAGNKKEKVLKLLLMCHGIFFPACLIMPMAGAFANMGSGSSLGGSIALGIWCLYFLPIGILSYKLS